MEEENKLSARGLYTLYMYVKGVFRESNEEKRKKNRSRERGNDQNDAEINIFIILKNKKDLIIFIFCRIFFKVGQGNSRGQGGSTVHIYSS